VIHNGFKTARPLARLQAGRTDWYRNENKADGPTEIYIYDEIGYVGVSAKDFVKDLNSIKDSEITLHLDTPGGDVYDGITIYNAIRDHKSAVTVIVDSMAASAGSFIAQAGDKRIMNRNSEMMIHDGHTVAIGNMTELAKMAEHLDRVSANIASIYAEHAPGRSAEQWRELMKAETWFSADEAVEAGLADEVVASNQKTRNDFDLSVFSYAGRDKAPVPVLDKLEAPEESPVAVSDWTQLADALKGAFA
jgi:ATP-dependent Clp endopeptidase proteolytic subunit ClpP